MNVKQFFELLVQRKATKCITSEEHCYLCHDANTLIELVIQQTISDKNVSMHPFKVHSSDIYHKPNRRYMYDTHANVNTTKLQWVATWMYLSSYK